MTKVFLLHFHFFTSDKACKPRVCCHPLHIFVRSLDMFFKIIISTALVVTVFTSFQWFTLTAVVWFYMCVKMAFVLKCFSTLSTFPRLLDLLWFFTVHMFGVFAQVSLIFGLIRAFFTFVIPFKPRHCSASSCDYLMYFSHSFTTIFTRIYEVVCSHKTAQSGSGWCVYDQVRKR